MLGFLKVFFTRTIIFYLVCFLFIWKMVDCHQLTRNAVDQTMSRLTPPINYFTELVDRPDHYDQFKLMNCINYHKAVADFFAFQRADAYGMLGFCYERLGQASEAVSSYKRAIALNENYFWPYYDLGVIYYQQGKYSQAADYFRQGLQQDPIKTFVFLSRSKVYNDVRLSKLPGTYDFSEGFKQGRIQAYILLMDCFVKTASYDQLWKTALFAISEKLDAQSIFYYYAGVAAFYQKSYQNAIESLQMSLLKDPQNADAFLYLGMCLHVAGQEQMAQAMMAKAAFLHKQGSSIIAPYLKPRVRFF